MPLCCKGLTLFNQVPVVARSLPNSNSVCARCPTRAVPPLSRDAQQEKLEAKREESATSGCTFSPQVRNIVRVVAVQYLAHFENKQRDSR